MNQNLTDAEPSNPLPLKQDFFAAMAGIHENAIARWDEAGVEVPEGCFPHCSRQYYGKGDMYWSVCINSGSRYLAAWIENKDRSDGYWIIREVTKFDRFVNPPMGNHLDGDGTDFESYSKFCDRVDVALGRILLGPVSDTSTQAVVE